MEMQVLLRLVAALSVLLLSPLWAVPGFAAKIGPEFQVNSFTAGAQRRSKVGAFSDGGFVVVWQSEGQDGDVRGIYARRYRPDGTRRGPEFKVNTTIAGSQDSPGLAVLSGGGFVIVWNSADASGTGIYAQRFRPDGTRAGPEFKANTRTANQQQRPSVAGLADGGFVVIWESIGQDGSGKGIYGQRYSGSGARIGQEFRVNTTTAGDQDFGAITGLANGGFVIVWAGQDSDGRGIFGQRYKANGTRAGNQFRVNTIMAGGQGNPSVAPWGDSGFVAVWDSPDSANNHGINAQRFDAQGRVGPEFRVNTTRPDFQIRAAVAALSNGGFVVVWESYGQGTDTPEEAGIFGQRYAPNGQRVGDEFRINMRHAGDQGMPSVAAPNNGGFVVVWQSLNQDGSDYGVFGQRYGQ